MDPCADGSIRPVENVTVLLPFRHHRVTRPPESVGVVTGLDSTLLLHEERLKAGEEWGFPAVGWTFLWLQSGEGYLLGCTPARELSAGMAAVHGSTCSLKLRASQLGEVVFRWFRLDPGAIFGIFTSLERRRVDHPEQLEPALPWILPKDHPATRSLARLSLPGDASSLDHRARTLEVVSAVLSPPPFRSATPPGSPRDSGDRLEELLSQLTDAELMALPVEDLAVRCRCTPRRLLSVYRERFGESLPGLQREWRRLKACSMLSQPGCAISTVATACGYDGADAFRAWFRREFGMSPSEWQQRNASSKARIK